MAAARQCVVFFAELRDNNFIDMTGISPQVFSYIYVKYCGPNTPIPRPSGLYRLLAYYKHYPIQRALPSIFPHMRNGRAFKRHIIRRQAYLAMVLNELQPLWDGKNRQTLTSIEYTYILLQQIN
jgi:hypothetical protein